MTASAAAVDDLLKPVLLWLTLGGDAWAMDLAYWQRRRRLMDGGESFDGPAAPYLSNIDTAMDVFSPDEQRADFQIDEAQLRAELTEAVSSLRRLGYLDRPSEQ